MSASDNGSPGSSPFRGTIGNVSVTSLAWLYDFLRSSVNTAEVVALSATHWYKLLL